MPWIPITEAMVRTRLAGAELNALQNAALGDNQTDPLPEIVAQVVDEVRGYVAAGGVTLGAGSTIPSKLQSATLAIIRYRLATRLPVKSFLTEDRKTENADALRLLNRVADGKYAVEEPTDPDAESIGAPSPRFSPKTRVYDRQSQDGI